MEVKFSELREYNVCVLGDLEFHDDYFHTWANDTYMKFDDLVDCHDYPEDIRAILKMFDINTKGIEFAYSQFFTKYKQKTGESYWQPISPVWWIEDHVNDLCYGGSVDFDVNITPEFVKQACIRSSYCKADLLYHAFRYLADDVVFDVARYMKIDLECKGIFEAKEALIKKMKRFENKRIYEALSQIFIEDIRRKREAKK